MSHDGVDGVYEQTEIIYPPHIQLKVLTFINIFFYQI